MNNTYTKKRMNGSIVNVQYMNKHARRAARLYPSKERTRALRKASIVYRDIYGLYDVV